MTAPNSRTTAVVLLGVQLSLVYLGARAIASLDLVVEVGGADPFGQLGAALAHVTLADAAPALLSALALVGANLSAARSLLVPERRRREISIASLSAIGAAYVAAASVASVPVEGATVAQLVVTLAAVQFEIARRRSVTFTGTLPLVFINAVFGIYLAHAPLAVETLAPALAVLVVYQLARVANSARPAQVRKVVAIVVAGAVSGAVLVISLLEYDAGRSVAYAPLDAPWRSLYFAIVLTGYAVVAISQDSASTARARRREAATLWLAAAMLLAIPLLICFTPHGIVLAVSSAVWLVVAFAIRRSRYLRGGSEVGNATLAILLLIALFGLLAADRFAHVSPTEFLSPVVVVLAAWGGVIGVVVSVVLPIVAVANRRLRKRVARAVGALKTLPRGADVLEFGVSFVMLSACYLWYAAAVYAHGGLPDVFDLEYATPPIEGFGGVNAFSWAAVAYALNLVVFTRAAVAASSRPAKASAEVMAS